MMPTKNRIKRNGMRMCMQKVPLLAVNAGTKDTKFGKKNMQQ